MINHVYEVVCDSCGNAEYVHGIQNKRELAAELVARGYVVKGLCTTIFCDVDCEFAGLPNQPAEGSV